MLHCFTVVHRNMEVDKIIVDTPPESIDREVAVVIAEVSESKET